ncbi:MAG: NADH-quinone oxidoreductase subunit J, partial [Terrimicrobiaceae bacterium]
MQLALFWVFAALMLIFGAAVVFLRNPVSSALSLVMSFIFLAALFITLDAFFIGVVQVLVYAGAVMVLFLFIIMLLDLRSERPRRVNIGAWIGGALVV